MPASRKRNKGKDRKAKKEEIEKAKIRENWLLIYTMNDECDHGCGVAISDDHPVSLFMDSLFTNIRNNMDLFDNVRGTLEKHPEVWNDNSHRQMAINTLVRIGTNMLLNGNNDFTCWAVCIAPGIMTLEHYNGTLDIDSVMNSRAVLIKRRDFDPTCSSVRRDILKFYRKRTSCKCLKRMHLEERKTVLKAGICYHCKEVKERSALSVCCRCMLYQYCSRECQIADWSEHKNNKECELYVHGQID